MTDRRSRKRNTSPTPRPHLAHASPHAGRLSSRRIENPAVAVYRRSTATAGSLESRTLDLPVYFEAFRFVVARFFVAARFLVDLRVVFLAVAAFLPAPRVAFFLVDFLAVVFLRLAFLVDFLAARFFGLFLPAAFFFVVFRAAVDFLPAAFFLGERVAAFFVVFLRAAMVWWLLPCQRPVVDRLSPRARHERERESSRLSGQAWRRARRLTS